MNSTRYIAQHESGGDWCVVDTARNCPIATGLDCDEADETAAKMNAEQEQNV